MHQCPICLENYTGSICPLCGTPRIDAVPVMAAAPARSIARTPLGASGRNLPMQAGEGFAAPAIFASRQGTVEGTVMRELPPAERQQRNGWKILAAFLFVIAFFPVILTIGIFAAAILILLAMVGMRFLGSAFLAPLIFAPFAIFRGNRRSVPVREYVLRSANGNQRVIQEGEWNSYLYEGCRVRLTGTFRDNVLYVNAGQDMDNDGARLQRRDPQLPWKGICMALTILIVLEATLMTGQV